MAVSAGLRGLLLVLRPSFLPAGWQEESPRVLLTSAAPRRGLSAIPGPHLGRGGCAPVLGSLRHPAHIFAHAECTCPTCKSFKTLCSPVLHASRVMPCSETRLRLALAGAGCVDHFPLRVACADAWLTGWLTMALRAQGTSRLSGILWAAVRLLRVRAGRVAAVFPDAHGGMQVCVRPVACNAYIVPRPHIRDSVD